MEKKIYKKPVSRFVVLDTDDILYDNMVHFSGGLETGDFTGDMVPVGDDDDNIYSKGGSWEMEW